MEEALIKRIPPHSIEAEQSVIGAMLLDRDAILIASEILTSDDFYQNQYGIIFDAMVELCNEGKPVDLITLQNRLKEKDLPPDISSMEYVRELIEAVPTSANVKYYANIVSEKALLRRLIKATEDVANTCYLEKESTEMILEESEKKLFNILQRSIGGDYVPIQQVVLNAINNIEKASKLKGSVTGIPTGFIDLDYKTSGMHPSDLVLIAARPSMGKTAFVLNIAQYMAFRNPDDAPTVFAHGGGERFHQSGSRTAINQGAAALANPGGHVDGGLHIVLRQIGLRRKENTDSFHNCNLAGRGFFVTIPAPFLF